MTPGARRRGGQAMVEFSLVIVVMMVTFFGIIDFSLLFAGRISTTDAVRNSARYAATNPQAFDSGSSPSSNSIQGRLVITSIPAKIINDDIHVTITYVVLNSSSTGTTCAQYSQSSIIPSGFTTHTAISGGAGYLNFASGYSSSNCVIPGDLILVKATYTYSWATPFLNSWFPPQTITEQASELEEV